MHLSASFRRSEDVKIVLSRVLRILFGLSLYSLLCFALLCFALLCMKNYFVLKAASLSLPRRRS